MALFPEKERVSPPEGVAVRPESPEIPEHIEKTGVTVPPTTFTGQVTDNSGQPVIQPTVTTLQIPTNQATLATQSKGPITSSLTWFAAFWLRMIKKAIHFGWRVVSGKGAEATK